MLSELARERDDDDNTTADKDLGTKCSLFFNKYVPDDMF